MPIYNLKLIARQQIAKAIYTFTFEKPTPFTFKPGQYGGFTLINPKLTDAGGITRRFSIASTPDESFLKIVTRIQNSAFKQTLLEMTLGSEIKFAGPTGIFVLHEEIEKPAVMIAGGIGIAPFYSMIRHTLVHQPQREIYLFYGNQNQNEAPFLEELLTLQKQHPHFKVIATMAADPDWHGECGYITHTMLKNYLPQLNSSIYYICGSPVMVTALQETLAEMDINEDLIRTEDFPGY